MCIYIYFVYIYIIVYLYCIYIYICTYIRIVSRYIPIAIQVFVSPLKSSWVWKKQRHERRPSPFDCSEWSSRIESEGPIAGRVAPTWMVYYWRLGHDWMQNAASVCSQYDFGWFTTEYWALLLNTRISHLRTEIWHVGKDNWELS